jgi:hypothetical protein
MPIVKLNCRRLNLKQKKEAVTLTFCASLAFTAAYHMPTINALKNRRYTSGLFPSASKEKEAYRSTPL